MASDPMPYSPAPHRTSMRTLVLVIALAFAAGIGVTIALVRYYAGWATHSAEPVTAGSASSGTPGSIFVPPPEADAIPRSADAMALDARLATLSGRLAAIEARTATIDRDSQAAASNAGRAEALLVAFAVRRALDRGLALGYLEGQLRARFGRTQPQAVATLIEASHNPVTVEDLRLSLDAIGPLLITGGTSQGWWPSLHREITGLIVIHPDSAPSPRPFDRLARIRRLLDARQVEAARAEVARMPGASQAGAWTAAAGRYIDAHRAVDLIEAAALIGPGQADPATVIPQVASGKPGVPTP